MASEQLGCHDRLFAFQEKGGNRRGKRNQKTLYRHRNANCQGNGSAGAADPSGLSGQTHWPVPHHSRNGQPADQGPSYMVPLLAEHGRRRHHSRAAVLRQDISGSCRVSAHLQWPGQRFPRQSSAIRQVQKPFKEAVSSARPAEYSALPALYFLRRR